MTLKIKFSHWYWKLPFSYDQVDKKATLLQVVKTKFELIPEWFDRTDTVYGKPYEPSFYQLPEKGDCLILSFAKAKTPNQPSGICEYKWLQSAGVPLNTVFSTIRRSTPTKDDYYIKSIGQVFDVIIEGD